MRKKNKVYSKYNHSEIELNKQEQDIKILKTFN